MKKLNTPILVIVNHRINYLVENEDDINEVLKGIDEHLQRYQKLITMLAIARKTLLESPEAPAIKHCHMCAAPSTFFRVRGDETVWFCSDACMREYDKQEARKRAASG